MKHLSSPIETKRHSYAHIMAVAISRLYPDTKFGIGPEIENGFYYDLDSGHKFSPDDLAAIEAEMRKVIAENPAFEKKTLAHAEGLKLFKRTGQPFKVELIEDLEKNGVEITIYTIVGDSDAARSNVKGQMSNVSFTDLCKGPHVASAGELSPDAFKLTKVAGAYWKGNEKNAQLQRIYGLAFDTNEELDAHIAMLAEAEKRDHRVLGEKLELFMVSDEVGKGLPLWLPNGAFIRHQLEQYMYEKEFAYGYKYVYTPVLTKKGLYETSGHLAHYRDDMYNPIDIEGEEYYLRPMNCPHHHMIYRHKPLSYRELPLRLAEFGLVHRFERSGVLTGLIRARGFTQNDSHIYCRKDQLKTELTSVMRLFGEVYKDFGIDNYWFRLSLPDFKNKEKFGLPAATGTAQAGDVQDKESWDEAGAAAREVLKEMGAKFVEAEGEASFYGPKIDIQIKNVLGKEDTIATCQIDFYSANKFDLNFVNEHGEKERVAIIHRAIMGSFDRFFAFLVEKTAGNFPLWLAPVQAQIIPVGDKFVNYAEKVLAELRAAGLRGEIDAANETLGKRIRNAEMQKIPYILVVGEKEETAGTVAVRSRDTKAQEVFSVADLIAKLRAQVADKK
ncbi:MAG: threonine--tRNA ligase [Candidatus Niyogibacteria bacterium]|nr:threonine--tRNA ligase [Candidatus Niyogibacteria bacterium]